MSYDFLNVMSHPHLICLWFVDPLFVCMYVYRMLLIIDNIWWVPTWSNLNPVNWGSITSLPLLLKILILNYFDKALVWNGYNDFTISSLKLNHLHHWNINTKSIISSHCWCWCCLLTCNFLIERNLPGIYLWSSEFQAQHLFLLGGHWFQLNFLYFSKVRLKIQ